jgi:DNA-binding transcriptional ArsR family regulator
MPTSHAADPAIGTRLLEETAGMFAMLSAAVRLHIVWLLAAGDRDVGTLAEQTGQSMATVSHHLSKLKLAGFVHARRQGRRQLYVLSNTQVGDVARLAIGDGLRQPLVVSRSVDVG